MDGWTVKLPGKKRVPGEPEIPHELFWRAVGIGAFGAYPVAAAVVVLPAFALILWNVLLVRNPAPPVGRWAKRMIDGYAEYDALWHERRAFRVRAHLGSVREVLSRAGDQEAARRCIEPLEEIIRIVDADAQEARMRARAERQTMWWQS